MAPFSFTAPVITPAQEDVEYNCFSAAERKAIQDDIVGHKDSFLAITETPAVIENGVRLFHEALHARHEW